VSLSDPASAYKAVLWDLDGTLTDPKEGITKCLQHTLRYFGVEPPPCHELQAAIGPPLHSNLHRFLGGRADLIPEAVEVYRERFRTVGIYEDRVYDGIPELLCDLQCQGIVNVLSTFKLSDFARTTLSHFGLDGYFHSVVGARPEVHYTDKRELIGHAIQEASEFGLREIVMVGDRMQDIEGARSNGIDSIGVLYGYGSREELQEAGATVIVETVDELRTVLSGSR
jgi:phosphoglycolate phosphatase